MAICDEVHKRYDALANKDVQVGELPEWMHVTGKVAWYAYQGPLSEMGAAWGKFHKGVHADGHQPDGAPGDLYVCDPDDHPGEAQKTLITIFWIPVK